MTKHSSSTLSGTIPSLFSTGEFPSLFRQFSLYDEENSGGSLFTQPSNNITLSEDTTHVYVEANLPGVSESEIEVTFSKGTLWIQGEKTSQTQENGRKYYYTASRSYSYRVSVPGNIDENQEPVATFENGVLTVRFSKQEKASPKKISVTTTKR